MVSNIEAHAVAIEALETKEAGAKESDQQSSRCDWDKNVHDD